MIYRGAHTRSEPSDRTNTWKLIHVTDATYRKHTTRYHSAGKGLFGTHLFYLHLSQEDKQICTVQWTSLQCVWATWQCHSDRW